MKLVENITTNVNLLRSEFTSLHVNILGIWQFFVHILIAAGIFFIFYLFGKKIRELFFKENKNYTFFVNIALGYIVISTGIGILGVFSLLRAEIILAYLGLVVCIALVGARDSVSEGIKKIKGIMPPSLETTASRRRIRLNVITLGVLLFVLIASLRLMTPEIGEDGYHTDLPRLYLASHTTIHEAKDPQRVIPYPQLAEMTYVIPIFLGDKEATRFIHFGFYVLVILLLFAIAKQKKSSFVQYAPLLFVTAPVVIKYSSLSFIDFFFLFCFLLSIFLLEKNSKRNIILSGIIFGGAIATKLWILIYLPAVVVYIAYIYREKTLSVIPGGRPGLRLNSDPKPSRTVIQSLFVSRFWIPAYAGMTKRKILLQLLVFVSAALAVGLVWYVRDYLITGSPIYPVFAKPEYLETTVVNHASIQSNFGFNWRMFQLANMVVLSPLFFLGVFFSVLYRKKVISLLKRFPLALFFLILSIEQLFISVYLGRHLLPWYILAIVIASAGMFVALKKSRLARFGSIIIFLGLFFYYLFTTVVTLPYGFGWADQNKYLTRVLGRDNANYYDFDHVFAEKISDKDLVATYGIFSYYYADFSYIDVNYIFSKENRSFDLLKKKGVTKLLVKGGDIMWFCKTLAVTQCNKNKVQLLATWPEATRKYNLYELRY